MSAHRLPQSRTLPHELPPTFEEMIAFDNPVRVFDAFVDSLDLEKMGFVLIKPKTMGAPPFHPAMLLKMYLYGYYNRLRSSRMLERECFRNIEMMWLTGNQRPSYHTIATFRSLEEHVEALKLVFKLLVQFCKNQDLIGGETAAFDGTKIRAQNSMKNNFNLEKMERNIDYHQNRFDSFLKTLDELDEKDDQLEAKQTLLFDKAEKALHSIGKHENYKKQLEASGETQISLIDADARALPLHLGIVQVGYNVQSVVDAKSNLLVHYEVTNQKDTNQLADLAIQTKAILGVETFTALADKGYHQGKSLEKCHENNIKTCVAPIEYAPAADPNKFRKEDFIYQKETDTYLCPNKQTLTTNNVEYTKKNPKGDVQYTFKRYDIATQTCQTCPLKAQCIANNESKYRHKKHIDRNQFDDAIERNRRLVDAHKDLYRKRQAMVEHPFGTLKRAWGMTFTLVKTIPKVTAEFGIICSAYNLRRLVTIFGVQDLQNRLREACFRFFGCWRALSPVLRLSF
jgi:transposase